MDAAKMIVVMGDMDAEMEKESCTAYESRRYVWYTAELGLVQC